jgi:outer membrane lipoprotein LolB
MRTGLPRWAAWGLCLSLLGLTACQTAPATDLDAQNDCRPAGASSLASAANWSPSREMKAVETPPPIGPSLALQGQLSVKLEAFGDQPAKGLSLGFFFNGRASDGDMDLMTLMGSQVARLRWSAQHAELTDGQGPHHYPSLAALSEAALGEALPLDTLIHWMQGRADPALPVSAGPAPDTFMQLGWLIDTRQLDEKKLSAQRAATPAMRGVRIKVYLDR